MRISTPSHIRALKRHHAKRGAFPKGKYGYAKYKCGLGFVKHFCGRRIRKTETTFFEIQRDWVFAPQEGAGGRRGGVFGFLAGACKKKKVIREISRITFIFKRAFL